MAQSANNAPISNQLAAEEEARVERTESSSEEEWLRYLEFVQLRY